MRIKKKIVVLCSLALFAGIFSPAATDSEAASIKLNKKTATITAKVGKKKLKCKVKVEKANKSSGKAASSTSTPTPAPTVPPATGESKSNVDSLSTDQLAANVDVVMEKIKSGKTVVTADKTIDGNIAYTLKNNSSEEVETKVTFFYYDANKKLVDADTSGAFLSANETKMSTFYLPSTLYEWDEDYENKTYKYSSYEIVAYSYSYTYSYS